jgi:cell division protein FtsX
VEHPVWIYAKDGAPFVRDFARQIKKVRVVSFDEKEAGLKRLKTKFP